MTLQKKPDGGRLVLLLRGINLGTSHRVSMADLRRALTDLGYAGARTHLQSGNVVVGGGEAPEMVARTVERELERRFGFAIPVIARTAEELAAVLAADPLGDVADDPTRYVVTFLDVPPKAAAVRSVTGQDFGAERFVAVGREVYQWCPGGQHESPLVRALSKAGVTSAGTARNWRTVTRLAELAPAREVVDPKVL